MDWYYGHILKYSNQKSCFDSLVENESLILNAINQLNQYVNGSTNASSFQAACANSQCYEATNFIADMFSESGSCPIVETLYSGYILGGYFQGWRDQVVSKSAYILQLFNFGVTAQSALLALDEPT